MRAEVRLRKEGEHLVAHRARVRPEQQVPAARRRQEVVRVAANQRQVDAELAQELGRHQTEQVSAGRGAQARCLGERPFRPGGPADDAVLLEYPDPQAGARQQCRRHEPVVARADHHHIDSLARHGRTIPRRPTLRRFPHGGGGWQTNQRT